MLNYSWSSISIVELSKEKNKKKTFISKLDLSISRLFVHSILIPFLTHAHRSRLTYSEVIRLILFICLVHWYRTVDVNVHVGNAPHPNSIDNVLLCADALDWSSSPRTFQGQSHSSESLSEKEFRTICSSTCCRDQRWNRTDEKNILSLSWEMHV